MAEDRMLSDEILLGLINKNSGGGGGTSDYSQLTNKPQINGNILTGNKSASDLGLASEDDLADKQDALTAGEYIDIDGNEISVNRELTPQSTTYVVTRKGEYSMNITKYIDGVQSSSTDYGYSQGTTRTIDDAFTLNDVYDLTQGYAWQFIWLKDSTTHSAGYEKICRAYSGYIDFTEVFLDEDLSGYKLIIKSEMDTALADKQDKTDNNLQTEDKTIVGAINEHEGDIDSLKSGLTNKEPLGGTTTGNKTFAVGGNLELRTDGEGGNITIISPNNVQFEIDGYTDTLRIWSRKSGELAMVTWDGIISVDLANVPAHTAVSCGMGAFTKDIDLSAYAGKIVMVNVSSDTATNHLTAACIVAVPAYGGDARIIASNVTNSYITFSATNQVLTITSLGGYSYGVYANLTIM